MRSLLTGTAQEAEPGLGRVAHISNFLVSGEYSAQAPRSAARSRIETLGLEWFDPVAFFERCEEKWVLV